MSLKKIPSFNYKQQTVKDLNITSEYVEGYPIIKYLFSF